MAAPVDRAELATEAPDEPVDLPVGGFLIWRPTSEGTAGPVAYETAWVTKGASGAWATRARARGLWVAVGPRVLRVEKTVKTSPATCNGATSGSVTYHDAIVRDPDGAAPDRVLEAPRAKTTEVLAYAGDVVPVTGAGGLLVISRSEYAEDCGNGNGLEAEETRVIDLATLAPDPTFESELAAAVDARRDEAFAAIGDGASSPAFKQRYGALAAKSARELEVAGVYVDRSEELAPALWARFHGKVAKNDAKNFDAPNYASVGPLDWPASFARNQADLAARTVAPRATSGIGGSSAVTPAAQKAARRAFGLREE